MIGRLGRSRLQVVLRRSGPVVTVSDAADVLKLSSAKAAQLLARWHRQGWLKRLRRGIYAPVPLESTPADSTLSRPWILVPVLFDPAYVGGWSAAEHWHLTEQIFRDTCVFTARDLRRRRISVEGTTFVLKQTTHFFGLIALWEGKAKIPISDPSRTLIDMLADPSAGGGIRHVESCLKNYLASSEGNPRQLIEYALKRKNGAVYKRLGFLLERSNNIAPEILNACRGNMTMGNAALDPSLPRERMITRWRLWVPVSWAEEEK